jgi:opacity protein-like surface antigen
MPAKIAKAYSLGFVVYGFVFLLITSCYAAPCYGTKMPQRGEFFGGFQSYSIFKRYLEDDYGKMRSIQNFFNLSYGLFDWFTIDLKGGAGDIKQRPTGASEIDYAYSFNGGYGLRLRLYDARKIKAVFGFQHISVHPKHTYAAGVKQRAVLDDWQTSLLASYSLGPVNPYIGTRWSRIDYIHWQGEQRKRKMSDLKKSWGLIFGFDIALAEKIWINLEGQFFDSQALASSVNFKF